MVGSSPGRGERDSETADAVSIDAILGALCHHRRRAVVDYFSASAEMETTIDELVNHLAREERPRDEQPTRDQLAIQLHHRHLPQLADAGIVEFDHRTGRLRYEPNDEIEEWLAWVQTWAPD